MQSSTQRHLRIITAFLFLLSANFVIQAQDLSSDDLKKFPENVHDSLYYELFKLNRTSNSTLAVEYSKQGLELARQFRHVQFEVKFYNALGWLHQHQGDYGQSEAYYQKGIALANKFNLKERLVFFYNNLGVLFEAQSRFDEALESYLKSLGLAKELNSFKDQIIAYNNIGLIFYRIEEYNQGIDYLSQGIAIALEQNIPSELVYSYVNRGLCLKELKKYDEAFTNFQEAEKLCALNNDCDASSLSDIYYGLGFCEYSNRRFEASKNYFKKGFQYVMESNNKVSISLYYFYQSKLQVADKLYNEALKSLEESDQYARLVGNKVRLWNNLELYSEIYEMKGDMAKALDYRKRFIESKDSVFTGSLKDNLAKIRIEEAQKEKQAIIERQQQIIKQGNTILILTLVALLLTFFVILLLYKLNKANKRGKMELEELVNKRTAELKLSNKKLRQANKEYENFLYRSYHDIKGPLATLSGLTRVALMEPKLEDVREHLHRIDATSERLNATLSLLILVNEIKSHVITLQQVVLGDMVEEVYQELHKLYPSVNFSFETTGKVASIITDSSLSRTIVHEVLKNAFFYSKQEEGNVQVVLRSNSNGVTEIQVSNNGSHIQEDVRDRIFDMFIVGSEKHGHGIGLYLARVAAERIGASIALKSASSPVIFSIYFPYRKE